MRRWRPLDGLFSSLLAATAGRFLHRPRNPAIGELDARITWFDEPLLEGRHHRVVSEDRMTMRFTAEDLPFLSGLRRPSNPTHVHLGLTYLANRKPNRQLLVNTDEWGRCHSEVARAGLPFDVVSARFVPAGCAYVIDPEHWLIGEFD